MGPWRVESEARPGHDGVTTYAVTNGSDWRVATLEVFDAPALAFGTYTERLRSVKNSVARIDHPGVLAIFDVGMLPDGRPYIVREMLDGITLATLMRQSVLPLGDALGILRGICDVLIAAHDAGVVHRAVSLDTVLLAGDAGMVKLIDWGVGDVIADEAQRRSQPGSISPKRRPVLSKKLDVYSVGLVMHRLLGTIPPPLEALWLAMMAHESERRPSMREVLGALNSLATKQIEHAVPPPMQHRVSAEQPVAGAPSGSLGTRTRAYWRHAAAAVGCMAAPLLFLLVGSTLRMSAPPARQTPTVEPRPVGEAARVVAARTAPIATRAPAPKRPAPRVATNAQPAPRAATGAQPAPRVATGAQPAPRVATGARPAPRAATGARPAPRVATGARPAPRVATGARPAPRVATGAQPAPRVATGAQPAPRPDARAVARPAARPAVPAPIDTTLLTQYQRVGRELLLLQRRLGPEATAQLSAKFKAIRIQPAMATAQTRQRAAATLIALQREIERTR